MRANKVSVSNRKEPVLLSDILPFEIPASMSNRGLYEFVCKGSIEVVAEGQHQYLLWRTDSGVSEASVRLVFGIPSNLQTVVAGNVSRIKITKCLRKIPLVYRVAHKEHDFRELGIIHPLNQLAIVALYEKYAHLMIYYANVGSFSLRRPTKLARLAYFKDRLHFEALAHEHEHESIEEEEKEYESLKTYFAYKEIGNVHKFFESYRYQRCERKYAKLWRFDISKCFDSIYSHSVAWAILGKEIVKTRISNVKWTFPGEFDRAIADANHGETNGIVIGPEFSRIFAEIILQHIDFQVHRDVESAKVDGRRCKFKRDYEVFRYVDDYFLFANDERVAGLIIERYRLRLREYKLWLNDRKFNVLERPLLTGLSIAKQEVSELIDAFITVPGREDEDAESSIDLLYASNNKLVTEYKRILVQSGVEYGEIVNFTLGCLDRKLVRIIKRADDLSKSENWRSQIRRTVNLILDFTFFLYAVSPQVNTTIKACLIISKVTRFVRRRDVIVEGDRHTILKKIFDEVRFMLEKNARMRSYSQIETLYLLCAIEELGKDYRLRGKVINDYLRIHVGSEPKDGAFYFVFTVGMAFVRDKVRYEEIRTSLVSKAIERVMDVPAEIRKDHAEATLLAIDFLACPYIESAKKEEMARLFGVSSGDLASVCGEQDNWFTRWRGFDFGRALDAKRSVEVY